MAPILMPMSKKPNAIVFSFPGNHLMISAKHAGNTGPWAKPNAIRDKTKSGTDSASSGVKKLMKDDIRRPAAMMYFGPYFSASRPPNNQLIHLIS